MRFPIAPRGFEVTAPPEFTIANTAEIGKRVKVTLDGEELGWVVAADTTRGFADVMVWDWVFPRMTADGIIVTERKFGKVIVTPM